MIDLLNRGDAAGGPAAPNDPQRLHARAANARQPWGPSCESLFDSLFSAELFSPPPAPPPSAAAEEPAADATDPAEPTEDTPEASEAAAAEDHREESEDPEERSDAAELAAQAAQAAAAAAALVRPEGKPKPAEVDREVKSIEAAATAPVIQVAEDAEARADAPVQELVGQDRPEAPDAVAGASEVSVEASRPVEVSGLRSTRDPQAPGPAAPPVEETQTPAEPQANRTETVAASDPAATELSAAPQGEADRKPATPEETPRAERAHRREEAAIETTSPVAAEPTVNRRQAFLQERRRGGEEGGQSQQGNRGVESPADVQAASAEDAAADAVVNPAVEPHRAAVPEAVAASTAAMSPDAAAAAAPAQAAPQPSAAAVPAAAAVATATSQPAPALAATVPAASTLAAVSGVEGVSTTPPTALAGAPATGPAPAAGSAAAAPQQAAAAVAILPEVSLTPYQQTRMLQRVLGGLERLGDGRSAVRLRLHPPELGALQVSLTMTRSAMSASITVEDASVAEVLKANLPALRQKLAEQGMTVERFDFQLAGDPSGDAQAGWAGDPQAGSQRGGGEGQTQRRELEAVAANRLRGVAGGATKPEGTQTRRAEPPRSPANFDIRA